MPDAETRVELRLEDEEDGATRITVVETGFAAGGSQPAAARPPLPGPGRQR